MYYNKDSGNGYEKNWTQSTQTKFKMVGSNSETEINNNNPGHSPEITLEYYQYSIDNNLKYYNYNVRQLLGTGRCWLASSYIGATESGADFSLREITDNYSVFGSNLYYSYGKYGHYTRTIKPIIVLKSDIELTSVGTNAWQIK